MQIKFWLLTLAAIAMCCCSFTDASIQVRTACQLKSLTLSCRRGHTVHVVSAFYGRASARICIRSKRDRSRWLRQRRRKRICAASVALSKVRKMCDGKRKCSVKASNKYFGNPCYGVSKYLRVRFACRFDQCKKVRLYQKKLLRQFRDIQRKQRRNKSKKNARKFKKAAKYIMRKINKLRRTYRSCFDCHRGCRYLHYVKRRFSRRERQVKKMMKQRSWRRYLLWNPTGRRGKNGRPAGRKVRASRWYLRRKLWYYRRHKRLIARHLRRCLAVCLY